MSTHLFTPAYSAKALKFSTKQCSSNVWQLRVDVPQSIIKPALDHISKTYATYAGHSGVSCAQLPLNYTLQYFGQEIDHDVKEFLYTYLIAESVLTFIEERKINTVNWPRLLEVSGSSTTGFSYIFGLSCAPAIPLDQWQNHTFIAPRRKNYTDLDAQVTGFMKSLGTQDSVEQSNTVAYEDWICFKAQLLSTDGHSANLANNYWINIAPAEIPSFYHPIFIGKTIGEQFTIPATHLFGERTDIDTGYRFAITVTNIIKRSSSTIEVVRKCLHTPDDEALHDKLMEIFSFRNDVSLRKAIIEELFYMLFSSYRFDIAPHAITRRKEYLLSLMQSTPECAVYTKQKEFLASLGTLAETKIKEEALVDAIAIHENISVSDDDLVEYLTLSTNDRLQEFIYFQPAESDLTSSLDPVPLRSIIDTVRREKTLNFILNQLAL